jgi:hypothetical protein
MLVLSSSVTQSTASVRSIPASRSKLHVQPVAMQHDGALQRIGGHARRGCGWPRSSWRARARCLRFQRRATLSPTLPPPITITTRSARLGLAEDLQRAVDVLGCG